MRCVFTCHIFAERLESLGTSIVNSLSEIVITSNSHIKRLNWLYYVVVLTPRHCAYLNYFWLTIWAVSQPVVG